MYIKGKKPLRFLQTNIQVNVLFVYKFFTSLSLFHSIIPFLPPPFTCFLHYFLFISAFILVSQCSVHLSMYCTVLSLYQQRSRSTIFFQSSPIMALEPHPPPECIIFHQRCVKELCKVPNINAVIFIKICFIHVLVLLFPLSAVEINVSIQGE